MRSVTSSALIPGRPAPAPAQPAPPSRCTRPREPRLHWSLRQAYGSCREGVDRAGERAPVRGDELGHVEAAILSREAAAWVEGAPRGDAAGIRRRPRDRDERLV